MLLLVSPRIVIEVYIAGIAFLLTNESEIDDEIDNFHFGAFKTWVSVRMSQRSEHAFLQSFGM